ncbi:MAG: hypothetical protein FJ304_18285 [Planctomycetes bacterium]|nr:hypothetical protein [Planctomycetota bacterium]
MGLPRGFAIPLTPIRRLMTDMLRISKKLPLTAIERTMPLADVIAARQGAAVRPSWFAIFIKAYGAVSARRPELRQSYLTWPYERVYQHTCTVATLAVARQLGTEEGVLAYKIRSPEQLTLAEIDASIRYARTEPVEQVGDFRRSLRLARMPRLVRRLGWGLVLNVSGRLRQKHAGTFGITAVSALGSSSLSLLSPLTTTLTYGVFAPDGRVNVRMFFDHRVMDGVAPAAAMEELEAELRGPVRAELLASAPAARAA